MNDIDVHQNIQIQAAESYLNARRNMLPATVLYVYEKTYNYLFTRLKRFV